MFCSVLQGPDVCNNFGEFSEVENYWLLRLSNFWNSGYHFTGLVLRLPGHLHNINLFHFKGESMNVAVHHYFTSAIFLVAICSAVWSGWTSRFWGVFVPAPSRCGPGSHATVTGIPSRWCLCRTTEKTLSHHSPCHSRTWVRVIDVPLYHPTHLLELWFLLFLHAWSSVVSSFNKPEDDTESCVTLLKRLENLNSS